MMGVCNFPALLAYPKQSHSRSRCLSISDSQYRLVSIGSQEFVWPRQVFQEQFSLFQRAIPLTARRGPGKFILDLGIGMSFQRKDMRNEWFAPHHNHNSYQEQHSNDCDNRHGALFYGGRCWKTEAVIIVCIQFLEAEGYCNQYKHITDPSSRNSYPDCTCFAQDGPHSLCGLLFHPFLHVHMFEMVIP